MFGKAYIWWQDINKVKQIKEIYVNWKTFKKLFKINTYPNNIMKKKQKNFMNSG